MIETLYYSNPSSMKNIILSSMANHSFHGIYFNKRMAIRAVDKIISHAFLLCVTKKDSIIDHIYGYYLDFETLTVPSRSMAHNDLMVLIEDIVKQSIDSFTEGSFFFL